MSFRALARHIAAALALLLCVSNTGCIFCVLCRNTAAQDFWQERANIVAIAMDTLQRQKAAPFSEAQLVALMPRPDFIGSPTEFEKAIIGDNARRESVMSELRDEFRRSKAAERYLWRSDGTPWREDQDFLKTTLFAYDETKHFSKPYWADPSLRVLGFHCYVFFVQDGKVVGEHDLLHWEGISERPP